MVVSRGDRASGADTCDLRRAELAYDAVTANPGRPTHTTRYPTALPRLLLSRTGAYPGLQICRRGQTLGGSDRTGLASPEVDIVAGQPRASRRSRPDAFRSHTSTSVFTRTFRTSTQ